MEDLELKNAREVLNREIGKIDSYEQLSVDRNFKIFQKELIDDPIEMLLNLLETAEDKEVVGITNQIKALRGITKAFKFTMSRKQEVSKRLKELEI